MPNKIYVPGLLTGRRKRRRSEEIVTGIYVPARGTGDPAGPAASAATTEAGWRGQGPQGLLEPTSPLI